MTLLNTYDFLNSTFSNKGNIDIYLEDNKYMVEAALPYFRKEDIKINFQDNILSIDAKKEDEREENSRKYYVKSVQSNTVSYRYKFRNVESSDISASFENGVLKVVLPLQEKTVAESKQIEIH